VGVGAPQQTHLRNEIENSLPSMLWRNQIAIRIAKGVGPKAEFQMINPN
jgi:hypothetical protein